MGLTSAPLSLISSCIGREQLSFNMEGAFKCTARYGAHLRLAAGSRRLGSSSCSSRARARARVARVDACHRCLARQLVPPLVAARPQALAPQHGARGPGFAAAVRGGMESQRQTESQQAAGPEQQEEQQRQQGAQQPPAPAEQRQQQDSIGVQAALAMLKFYKGAISPLLPPACRFLPTCSVYAMDAFQRYGVSKGFVLTAWRLFRCTPWGNSGYDPVRWPPPGLEPLFGGDSGDSSGGSSSSSGGGGGDKGQQ